MLGNEILSARLGGIYALQQLAADYPGQYYLRVIRLLQSFQWERQLHRPLSDGARTHRKGRTRGHRRYVRMFRI